MHFSQFLWLKYLSNLGYFKKRVLVLGNPDKRLPVDQYFQDIGNTKEHVGSVTINNGKYLWNKIDNSRNVSVDKTDDIKHMILKENIGEILFF